MIRNYVELECKVKELGVMIEEHRRLEELASMLKSVPCYASISVHAKPPSEKDRSVHVDSDILLQCIGDVIATYQFNIIDTRNEVSSYVFK